tara:strand:- start:2792 stop:3010 length:219 start_codon:yes stop_codon:yes gene_type:complete
MKIVLSLIICSALAGECKPPFQHKEDFHDWASCVYRGYNDSLQLLNIMGDDYINSHQIFIKFSCIETPNKKT